MKLDLGQAPALLRQGGQFAAGGVSVLVVLGSIDADTAKNLVADIGQVVDGLSQATAGFGKIIVIVAPIVAGVIAKFAVVASGTKASIDKLRAVGSDPTQPTSTEANTAIKAAASSIPNTVVVTASPSSDVAVLANKIAAMPESHSVITTADIASSAPSPKVVSPAV
jgi:hypothetical protein